MNIDELTAELSGISTELTRLGVKSLSVFGSVLRGSAGPDSDVDFVVEFTGPSTFRGYFSVLELLESKLGRKVDLAEPAALRPELRSKILAEARRVA